MVESLQGRAGRDANENRFAKTCSIEPGVSERLARRSAELRRRAKRGSAVDAIVVAMADRAARFSPGMRKTSNL